MEIIINADDFGLTSGVNRGIIDAHQNGVVTRTTLLMNGLAVEEAIELAKANPALKVGIHLALSFGKPLSNQQSSVLLNENGYFKYSSIEASLSQEEINDIRIEWHHQIRQFLKTGLTLDHIDSHHHVHGWNDLKDLVIELSETYDIPVRYADTLANHPECLLTEYIWLDFYKNGVTRSLFDDLFELPYHSVEVMVHPALVDDELEAVSSYTDYREKETAILKSITPLESMTLT